MKQKIVIKVHMSCDKCRKEAMKIAATANGVISVTIQGNHKDEIIVVGNEVDPATMCTTLRKKVGNAMLISVEEVKDPKPEDQNKKTDQDKSQGNKKKQSSDEKKTEEKKVGQKEEQKKPEKNDQKQEQKGATVIVEPGPPIYGHYGPYYPPPNYNYGCPNTNPQFYVCTDHYDNSGCVIM